MCGERQNKNKYIIILEEAARNKGDLLGRLKVHTRRWGTDLAFGEISG